MKIDSLGSAGFPEKPEKPSGSGNEQSSGDKIEDSAILASSQSSWLGSIMKKLEKAKDSIMGDDTEKKSEEAGAPLDPSTLSRPDVYEKIKKIKDAGYSFHVQKYKEPDRPASDGEVYRRYGENEKQYFGLALKKGSECIRLPHTEEDLELFSCFYLGDNTASLKNPDVAMAIQKVYASGNCFYDRYLEDCYHHKTADALYTYSHAVRLKKDRDPQQDLHFRDGERFFQIESEADFKRACVLSGAMDKGSLSQDEAKALPIILDMLGKGAAFKERYGNSKVGPLALLRAVGEGYPSVMYIDPRGSMNEIKSLRDIERVQSLYDKKDLSAMGGKEKRLIELAGELIQQGAVFTDLSVSGKPYGAAMVVKAALQEDKDVLREPVYYKDERNRLSEINRPEDLTRIRSIYFDRDYSKLPPDEQALMTSLDRIFGSKDNPAVKLSSGELGFLKGILGESYYGNCYLDGSDRPLSEKICSAGDIDRYVAIYINKDLKALPQDEKEAVERLKALKSAGVSFQNSQTEKIPYLHCLQVLKGEDRDTRELWLKTPFSGEESGTRINNCADLARLEALWLKKDLSLLSKDEQELISGLRELRGKGMIFKGYYDGSELTILKGVKGELGKAFVRHKSGTESVLDDPLDFQRLKALYVTGDLGGLPKGEREIAESIQFMKDQGYYCAVAYDGRIKYVEPFDVLKSAIKGYTNIGFVDKDQAFTGISSPQDLADLRAIHLSQGLDSFSYKELKLIKLIQDLMRKGYKFHADSKFSDIDSLGNRVSGTRYYPVGPLAVMKGLRGGNTNLWLYKDNTRVPITDFLDVIDMFDRVEKMSKEKTQPPEKKVQEEDGFVIIGGVRLPVHG